MREYKKLLTYIVKYWKNAAIGIFLNLMGTFTYTQEVFLNLAFKGLRLTEVPIRVRGQREHGRSRVASNLFRYAFRTSDIIFRCYRDYRPMRFFGLLATCLAVPGIFLLAWLWVHYLMTGRFSGQIWAGFTGGALLATGIVLFLVGMIGDMLNRHRIYLEEMLFFVRDQKNRSNP